MMLRYSNCIIGSDVDALREFTHPSNCKCYPCQARPWEHLKNEETWESKSCVRLDL